MEKPKGPVVLPPQATPRPDTAAVPEDIPEYVPPVEKQPEPEGAGSEVSDGEDA